MAKNGRAERESQSITIRARLAARHARAFDAEREKTMTTQCMRVCFYYTRANRACDRDLKDV